MEREKERGGGGEEKTLRKLRTGDSVLMPSLTGELACEGEPVGELGG